ncbi:MAG: hypothetical protein MJZ66_02855 [Bacteroidales bacterium]|nr:hypothetical protein [Bacteroidales bacterium]
MAHKSTIKRAELVKQIVDQHYEPGRQDRCKLWVYRTKILPIFGISLRTFFNYLRLSDESQQTGALQLSLW